MVESKSSETPKTVQETAGARKRGRPRREEVDEQILRAALEMLSAEGFAAMSMDAVAERAGVSKPTIYRRWSTKIELASACISLLLKDDPPNTASDVWEALLVEIQLFSRALGRDHGISIIGTLLAHEEQQPSMIAEYRKNVASVRRSRIRGVFDRGIADGQLPADVDVNLAVNMMLGYYYASHIGGDARPADWPVRCVNLIRKAVSPESLPQS